MSVGSQWCSTGVVGRVLVRLMVFLAADAGYRVPLVLVCVSVFGSWVCEV